MVTDSPLMLVDEETLTYYCYGCNRNTQDHGHTCEGQVDRMVKTAKNILGK
jgi:hypothetical protein